MGTFDGSLESAVAVVDAVLEDNPRASGKMVREALSGSEVTIPTVEGEELVTNDDGSVEFGGARFVPDSELVNLRRLLEDARKDLLATESELVAARNELSNGKPVDGLLGSSALAEAADLLMLKPHVSTTNGKVAKWLRTL